MKKSNTKYSFCKKILRRSIIKYIYEYDCEKCRECVHISSKIFPQNDKFLYCGIIRTQLKESTPTILCTNFLIFYGEFVLINFIKYTHPGKLKNMHI